MDETLSIAIGEAAEMLGVSVFVFKPKYPQDVSRVTVGL